MLAKLEIRSPGQRPGFLLVNNKGPSQILVSKHVFEAKTHFVLRNKLAKDTYKDERQRPFKPRTQKTPPANVDLLMDVHYNANFESVTFCESADQSSPKQELRKKL